MKKSMLNTFALSLLLTITTFGAAVAPIPQPGKIDIYPTNFSGGVIYNKVFTVSPAMPNGATSFTNGNLSYARVAVVTTTCSAASRCFKKNITYTISDTACFNRLNIRFLGLYSAFTEPSVNFSENYNGNEGFQVSGGSQFVYSLLPRLSPDPCG